MTVRRQVAKVTPKLLAIVVGVAVRSDLVLTRPLKNDYQLIYCLKAVKYDDNMPLPMIGAITLFGPGMWLGLLGTEIDLTPILTHGVSKTSGTVKPRV